ncbi:collagenase [Solibacillus sp. CAU 1738]|uniref:collagenase n=1 Tax=Solibacillus sp. CAU 1738 TaxID=3140363 RepID=UPI00326014DC
MKINRRVFLASVSITFLIGSVFMLKNSASIEKILANNAYTIVDHTKIFNLTNTDLYEFLLEEINTLDTQLYNLLGSVTKAELNIIIFKDIKDLRKHTNLENIGAFFDPKSNTIALSLTEDFFPEFNKGNFIRYLRHEYTHYYLTSYIKYNSLSSVPKWFDEGIADYVAITMEGGSPIVPTEKIIDFTVLNTRREWAKYRKKSSQLYIQSHFAINYIIQQSGQTVVKKIIDESNQIGFPDSFYKNTNIELSELHNKMWF